jgi:hypothetical protein
MSEIEPAMQTQGEDVVDSIEYPPKGGNFLEVLAIFTRLGLTSFGGQSLILATFVKKSSFAADGSMNERMATCLDCASFCRDQRVVKQAFRWASCVLAC